MKANLIKELHAVGVFRDPQTKQKLECMKVADILQVKALVYDEIEKGVRYERKQCSYEFVSQSSLKKAKADGKKKRK